ncbi:MAG: hypothetical protein HAW67_01230, partial [Endozoicomonadaceae bacterium]|nr:hypothetical protein [Endozoicomonadaceae bacterium]
KNLGFGLTPPITLNMSYDVKPTWCDKKAKISFLLRANRIIAIQKKTIHFDKLSFSSLNIATDKLGNPTYLLGAFPSISEHNDYAVFNVEFNNAPFGELENISAAGKVSYYTATSKEAFINKSIDLSLPFSVLVGDLVMTNMNSTNADERVVSALSGSTGMLGLAMGGDKRLHLKFIGNKEAISSVKVYHEGEELEQDGQIFNNNIIDYSFYNTNKSSLVDIEVNYWKGLVLKTAVIKL